MSYSKRIRHKCFGTAVSMVLINLSGQAQGSEDQEQKYKGEVVKCSPDFEEGIFNTKFGGVLNVRGKLEPGSNNRLLIKSGEKYYVIVEGVSEHDVVQFTEVARKTKFASDLDAARSIYDAYKEKNEDTLENISAGLVSSGAYRENIDGKIEEIKGAMCVEVAPRLPRGILKVEVADKFSGSIITGPSEKFYMTADVLLKRASQLKISSDSSGLVLKESPNSFYLGFNYKFGDVFTDYPGRRWYKDLALKGMVLASAHPSDSMGLGLAYHFDAAEIFVAKVLTKGDVNPAHPEGARSHKWGSVVGVSFGLDKAIEWTKSLLAVGK